MRKFMITVQGVTYEVDVEEVAGGAAPVAASVQPAPVVAAPVAAPMAAPKPAAPAAAPAVGGQQVKAPMPGTILNVNVQVGQAVKKGDILCILEAMKMENEILSPADGKVAQIMVSKGSTVNPQDVLAVIA